ncbi:MAG: SelB C-terminal domain-containing protein, partial [Caldimicrobium sp.]
YLIEKKGIMGISLKNLSLQTALFGKKLETIFNSLNEKILFLEEGEETYIFTKETLEELKKEILEKLQKFHENNPFATGLNKEFLKSRLLNQPREKLFEKALNDLLQQNKIVRERELYFLPDYQKKSTEFENIKKQLELKFLNEGLTPRDIEEIIYEFGKSYKAAEEVLKVLLREGTLIKVSEKIVYHKKILEEVENRVREYFKTQKELTVSDFRKIVGQGVSRKYLIPLLEYLDKQKVTLRIGDKRILRKG